MSTTQVRSQETQTNEQDEKRDAVNTRMTSIKSKLVVLSGKGGVGKSTVAVNLAVALSKSGLKVGLLDVDLHGPSVPKMLGLEGKSLGATQDGVVIPFETETGLKVVSVGFLVQNKADPVIWRGPMKYNVIRQFLGDVEWGELDCLVADLPPGTGDEPLGLVQLIGADSQGVIVTTPQDVAIADVRRSVSFCRQLELPVSGIIENMSGFVCPHCGKTVDVFKRGGGELLAHEMGVSFLGTVPLDPEVTRSGDKGIPLGEMEDKDSSATVKAFDSIVKALRQSSILDKA